MTAVREKVDEWVAGGYAEVLTEPAHCCNPLSDVEKYDVMNDKIKLRVVLDMSRHVNNCREDWPVKLDDLTVAESILEPFDYLTAFDLKNQFFHVQLHPSQKKYFGFAVPDTNGVVKYYQFKILVYGCKPAVAIVTKLLKPIKSYLHKFGIKATITLMMGGWQQVQPWKQKQKQFYFFGVYSYVVGMFSGQNHTLNRHKNCII
jgi:hypothetical protein